VSVVITFRVRRSQGEMYGGHGRLSVCLFLAAFPHHCTDPDVTWGNGRRCPLVVHYWTDLQPVHRFRCYDNIAPNAKCQRVLVLALRLVELIENNDDVHTTRVSACVHIAPTNTSRHRNASNTRMWANAQPDGRPAEHRWRPLFNAAKFG